MAIDISIEAPLSLTEATKVIPPIDGRRVSSSTIFRWIRRGLRGVQLESVRCGHRLCTSAPAIQRFFTAVSEADQKPRQPEPNQSPKPHARTSTERGLAVERAKRNLASMGV